MNYERRHKVCAISVIVFGLDDPFGDEGSKTQLGGWWEGSSFRAL